MSTLIVIEGPTASGKTTLAIQLAQHFSTEILSADSRQFYKGLNIGTAKPSQKELSSVKHHFIDSLDLTDDYNISDFEKDALSTLHNIFSKKNIAVLAGGSGLYIRAVCEGIDEIPGRDESIRLDIIKLLEENGITALQNKLKILDPEYHRSVDLSNTHRLVRALEVCISTGQKYSGLRKNQASKRDFNIIKIGLLLEREELYKRIDQRVDEMVKQGLVQEVKSFIDFRERNSLNTVGYKEIFEFLNGNISLEIAIDLIKKNTRNYAKRQMTWFRREEGITWFDPNSVSEIINFLEEKIAH